MLEVRPEFGGWSYRGVSLDVARLLGRCLDISQSDRHLLPTYIPVMIMPQPPSAHREYSL
jgi:hypothetical protein